MYCPLEGVLGGYIFSFPIEKYQPIQKAVFELKIVE